MRAKELREILEQHDGGLPVFFRCTAQAIGNVREVDRVELTTYGFFGKEVPCIILDVAGPEEEEADPHRGKCEDCGHWHDETEREGVPEGEGIIGCMWCECGHRDDCPCAGCAPFKASS